MARKKRDRLNTTMATHATEDFPREIYTSASIEDYIHGITTPSFEMSLVEAGSGNEIILGYSRRGWSKGRRWRLGTTLDFQHELDDHTEDLDNYNDNLVSYFMFTFCVESFALVKTFCCLLHLFLCRCLL
jgi:hypothetical protein